MLYTTKTMLEPIKQLLLEKKVVSKEEFEQALQEADSQRKSLEQVLFSKKLITEDLLYGVIAEHYHLPFVNLKEKTIRKDILATIPEPIASSHEIIAFDKNATTMSVAASDPDDIETFTFLKKTTGLEILVHVTTPTMIHEALKQYHSSLKAEFEALTKVETDVKEKDDSSKLKELAEDLPIIRIVDTLLEYAIFEGASDIHIEPSEREVVVRYRVDGILHDVMTLPKQTQAGIVARIKILSNLKLDEHRVPQDGRFKLSTPEYKISFRVSVIPVFDGEKIVMRLLNESSQILTLEQLGFQNEALEIIKRNIKKPHGMILVTGPTGSGKTTTLYTILNILNTPDVNITTIEDPIEYRMQRVNQSQVNPKIGYTFASGLRAFLRQDPNVIMVGEIRDTETAEIAVNAAMTGHLVLSTLHTNDAPTALPRLQDMNIPPFLIASTTNIIVAQRLVRKVCQACKSTYKLDKKQVQVLGEQFDLTSIQNSLGKGATKNFYENLVLTKGQGCKSCNQSGYKGRLGIYEVLEMTPTISDLVIKKASSEEIKALAAKEGMITMLQDGFLKIQSGMTTLEEVMRVTKE